jgi:beta-galactosidase
MKRRKVADMKQSKDQDTNRVTFLADSIVIDNKPRIVLCASVFYFRIPRDEWKDRLEKVKAAGYNCIDIYFPWNYHEIEENNWDFSGEKDVDYFFTLARELDLWVIARPGPYICSEWDMGALPAYLLTKDNLILRDYNEVYLSYVKKWYEKIMPIIATYQIGKQGTVIAVQIENELDFYDCKQVDLYISALRDYAIDLGIQVPIVVCAGQCDIERAGGLVKGVVPTINLYPDMREKTLEDKVNHYMETFREMNLPLCITETSTSHFILRRELIAGAKFIAPYNQVSGTDFGFTTSVNNWGSPMTYMTHDYNLNGMINPQGELLKEYDEAYLFSGLIQCFENEISTSRSIKDVELITKADCKLSSGINHTLIFKNGGKLAAFPNIDEDAGDVTFIYNEKVRPSFTSLRVNPLECPILPFDILYNDFDCKLAFSTAEMCHSQINDNTLNLLFYTNHEAEIALSNNNVAEIAVNDMHYEKEDRLMILYSNSKNDGNALVTLNDGKKVHLFITSREKAVQCLKTKIFPWEKGSKGFESILSKTMEAWVPEINEVKDIKGINEFKEIREFKEIKELIDLKFLKKYTIPDMGKTLSCNDLKQYDRCECMEDMGYYRGYGWYEGNVNLNSNERTIGYMLYNGMDIIHIYRNNSYLETIIGDGTYKFVEEPSMIEESNIKLGARCEIWGHSNFSDSRLPAMDIRAKKGLKGLALITNISDITEFWCYCKDEIPYESVTKIFEKDKYRPIIRFSTYNNPEQPQKGVYKRKVQLDLSCDAKILELKGFKSFGKVYVDGNFVQDIQPYNTTVSLDEYCKKDEIELAVYLDQKTIQESKDLLIMLYEGHHISNIQCRGADDRSIIEYINTQKEKTYKELASISMLNLEPGEVALVSGIFETRKELENGVKLSMKGNNIKVLVILNGQMIGRLWLPSNIRPEFRGGDESILYLPKSFMKEMNQIDLLIEAMKDEPVLEAIQYIGLN